ncbi:MarR family transcriptional regulator [Micromonospora sp. WMMD558]|uniref:MarR family transcriptional regulator n=1 Tax=Micromonospora sp. WMMD558 TaxID=3403462 RepID=UPI003BF4AC26
MTNATEAVPAHSMFTVLAALGALGEATAGEVAEHAGLGYSTTTAKLRAWEQTGQAERFRTDDGRTLWRLTDTGRTATATAPTGDGQQPSAAQESANEAGDRDVTDERPQNGDIPATPTEPLIMSATDQAADQPAVDTAASTARTAAPPTLGDPQETSAELTPNQQPGTQEEDSTPEDRQDRARRGKGSLRGAILDILEAHPDRAYKTGELCKLIDANRGAGVAKASAGAVANAATKLVADGLAVQTVERPATFQVSPTRRGNQ